MHGTNAWALVKPILALGVGRLRYAPRVPITSVFDLWAESVHALADASLPIAIGRRVRLENLELMGLAVLTAATGHAALAEAIRYAPLITDSGRWCLDDASDVITITWQREGERSLGHRLANEAGIAQFVACMRQLCGPRFTPEVVRFRHAAPTSLAAHRAYFRCAVEFGADTDAFTFPRHALDVVPSAANPAVAAFVRAHADTQLAAFDSLATRVRAAIDDALARGERPTIGEAARSLGTSERTLRRRVSWAALVDEAIKLRARTLVTQTDRSLTTIALELGFSDASAFSHAYRRWFGCSATSSRRAAA
jgi:AraC-like DNA-binding protein